MLYINEKTGQYREIPTGFSFTTLFFGPIPMLFRGETGYFFLQLILAIVTMGLSHLFFIFAINGMCEKKLLQDGFRPEIRSDDKEGPSTTTWIIMATLAFVLALPYIFNIGSNNQDKDQEITQIETPTETPTEAPTTSMPKVIPEAPQEVITAPISDIPLPDHKPIK